MEEITIIGIKCDADEKKAALGLGLWTGGKLILKHVFCAVKKKSIFDEICNLVSDESFLLYTFDAPLGWPQEMAHTLNNHKAGEPIYQDPDSFFNRETDLFLKKILGKKPFEIGADKIAKTTQWSLLLLQSLREKFNRDIPLVWDNKDLLKASAIEVCPDATLRSRGIYIKGYKNKKEIDKRRKMIENLEDFMNFNIDKDILAESSYATDAAINVLAGSDFLRGDCIPPPDEFPVHKEGWIWFR